MAEFIFQKLVTEAGLSEAFEVASAATSTEELGNPVYPPARKKLAEHGIYTGTKTARQLKKEDYIEYNYLIGMDDWNMKNIHRLIGDDTEQKIFKLSYFSGGGGDIDDPWYSGDFDRAYDDIYKGCKALFHHLQLELLR
jgi:protein-tyrosine phosphatase